MTKQNWNLISARFVIFIFVFGLVLPHYSSGQGTIYVSNLGEPPFGSAAMASDSWGAAYFRTGTNSGGYVLNSVELLMSANVGNPNGIAVSIFSYANRFPGNSLGALTGNDPTNGGVVAYSTTGIMLLPSTYYFVVVTSASSTSQGSFGWNTANTAGFNSSEGWLLGLFGAVLAICNPRMETAGRGLVRLTSRRNLQSTPCIFQSRQYSP